MVNEASAMVKGRSSTIFGTLPQYCEEFPKHCLDTKDIFGISKEY
jgi:hypothetical protein